MILTNLVLAGSAKCGTSSLHEYLKVHQDIKTSSPKEPHFYSRGDRYSLGSEYVTSLYEKEGDASYYLESSTSYFFCLKALDRIYKDKPETKLVFLLRNPIDRVYSHYTWLYNKGLESSPFEEAMAKDASSVPDANNHEGGCYKYYYRNSHYKKTIDYAINLFGRQNVFVMNTDLLKIQPLIEVNNLLEYLELPKFDVITTVETNKTQDIQRVDLPRWRIVVKKLLPTALKKGMSSYVKKSESDKFGMKITHKELSDKQRLALKSIFTEDVQYLKDNNIVNTDSWIDFNKK